MSQSLSENLSKPANTQPDRHRPQYHFLPAANWLNDPNGVIHWQGEYHLFYQYNPNGAFWGTIHWGHAVSSDLVHWRHLPLALTPSPDTADEDGCWSGYAVNHDGVPTLIYTGIRGKAQLPCLATSQDNLVSWHKYEGNPIIPAPPEGLDVIGFRDHCVWKEADGKWYQAIGAGFKDGGGAVLLYASPDLLQWEYLGPLRTGTTGGDTAKEVWECPDFFPLGDKHVLLISSTSTKETVYFVGDYVKQELLTQDSFHTLDYGGYLYAPQTLFDAQGRRLMWGWLREGRNVQAQREAGWSGVMTLPLLLSLTEDNRVGLAFAPELQQLRGQHYGLTNLQLEPGQANPLDGIQGDCLEIELELEPNQEGELALLVCCSLDGVEQTRIVYNPATQQLTLDSTQSSLNEEVQHLTKSTLHYLGTDEPLNLHIFLDRSVIELSANGRTYLTNRVYPTYADSTDLGLLSYNGKLQVRSLNLWQMNAIW